jgi:hypothetical protein
MSEILNATFAKLMDDEVFKKNLEERLNEITKDGKINSDDIPDIMLIILDCTDNLDKFELTYDELVQLLDIFINYILTKYNLIQEKDEEEFKRIIKTVVKLTLTRPKVKTFFTKLWKRIVSSITNCCK